MCTNDSNLELVADANLSLIWANFGLLGRALDPAIECDDKVGNTFLITVKSRGESFDGKW